MTNILDDVLFDCEANQYFNKQKEIREEKARHEAIDLTIDCPNCTGLPAGHEAECLCSNFSELEWHLLSTNDFDIDAHSVSKYNDFPHCNICKGSYYKKNTYIEHLKSQGHKDKVKRYIEHLKHLKRREEYHEAHRKMTKTLFDEFNDKYKRDPNEEEFSDMQRFIDSLIRREDYNLSQGYSKEFTHLNDW